MKTIRLTIKQLKDGRWAAWTGNKYFTDTVAATADEARVLRLKQIGREAQDTIDAVDRGLEALGALDDVWLTWVDNHTLIVALLNFRTCMEVPRGVMKLDAGYVGSKLNLKGADAEHMTALINAQLNDQR